MGSAVKTYLISTFIKERDPFNQNFRKFRSKTQWIGSVQPEKFRKNGSTFWGGPLFPVGPVGILVEWIAPKIPQGINDRLMAFRLFRRGNRYATVISKYAPTMTNLEEMKYKFYKDLKHIIKGVPKQDKRIIINTSNATVCTGGVIGRNGVRKCNSNGLLLLETSASHMQFIGYPPTPRRIGCTHAASTGISSIMFPFGEEKGRMLEWQGRCAEQTAGHYLKTQHVHPATRCCDSCFNKKADTNNNKTKLFYNALQNIYGPQSSGTSPLEGTTLHTEKNAILESWVEYFISVRNTPQVHQRWSHCS